MSNAFVLADDDLVTAAVERSSGIDADESVGTTRRLVLLHLQPAHHTPSVQPPIVMTQLVDQVLLLVGEVALQQQLAGEEIVASERSDVARCVAAAAATGRMILVHLGLSFLTPAPPWCRSELWRRVVPPIP